jgi:dATP pyrophosphohydrolase
MRAAFQVIVFPYRIVNGEIEVLIGKRADDGYWQAISGGGEGNEKPLEAAKRELLEEAGMTSGFWMELDSKCMLPKVFYADHVHWDENLFVIPEYSFAINAMDEYKKSDEHSELRWVNLDAANDLLKYDSNKTALWELTQRVNM